jgi:PhzF family phenazine biosynthesis protein
MKLPIFQIDAFTEKVFRGNPACVCPLERWPRDLLMQAIAAENNVPETAFFLGQNGRYKLRWFTPLQEVDLCGHATLAAAWVVFNVMEKKSEHVTFTSKSGPLRVSRTRKDVYALDFPARPGERIDPPAELVGALGIEPKEVWAARDYMAVYETEEQVRALRPDIGRLRAMKDDKLGVIVTAPGEKSDFVSRFFAPKAGIPEDPVTGSAHCTLIPYWAERLGKDQLYALQVSRRQGELFCMPRGERVAIAGRCVLYMKGAVQVPGSAAGKDY